MAVGPNSAQAGGLFLPGHGVRGSARAGAFTAGGDDPGGLWYAPSNMGFSRGTQALADLSLIFYSMDYSRVDSGGNSLPSVSNQTPVVPVPNLAVTSEVWRNRLWVGGGVSAPYAPLTTYPTPSYDTCTAGSTDPCLDTAHRDAPQRYSMNSLDGSWFLKMDLALAYRLLPGVVVGASLQNTLVRFITVNTITSYNGTMSSGPEDPEFDSLAQMEMVDLFNPSANLSVHYQPQPAWRLAVALQLPVFVEGDAQTDVQLPNSAVYQDSTVVGNNATVSLNLPLILRTGVEWRPRRPLRLELGVDWERWSGMESIKFIPRDIYILDLPGIGTYKVPELAIPLNFRDTLCFRLGGEYALSRLPLVIRGGYLFERSAVEDAYASVLAVDTNKHVLSLGAGLKWGRYRFDLTATHSFSQARTVDYRESRSLQVNPINPDLAVGVGGGHYDSGYTVLGIGVNAAF